ncbi:MAG: NADP-dependent malic enzyme [Clostridiales bacterium]
MNYNEESLKMHQNNRGKIEVISKVELLTKDDLSIAYTPGVAEPCRKIHESKENVYRYTSKGNLVAVVSDGSAVLGLGNIGPEAAMPVMEGKAILFKNFAGVDAFPICLNTQDTEEIIRTIKYLEPTFGGINIEDIGSPRCFEIEQRLKKEMNIPVFHDDQHGTATVVAAGLINALKLANKKFEECRIVVNGPGAAGTAIVKMLLNLNAGNIIVCDKDGILFRGKKGMISHKVELAHSTNNDNEKGKLEEAVKTADIFIGVSGANILTPEMVRSMNKKSIIFAMANPIPEILPEVAKEAGAYIVGTGRSDFPNQINNVLAFPGIFKGALSCNATDINEEMKVAAAYAIANAIPENELNENFVIPDPFNRKVVTDISTAVIEAANKTGISNSGGK